MEAVEIPPDATVFRSGGIVYYLYFGLNAIKALQRKWGFSRLPGDSNEEYSAKCLQFQARIDADDWQDRVDVMHASLCHWAARSGNGSGPVVLTDDEALAIFEAAEVRNRPNVKKYAPLGRMSALWTRFSLDRVGLGPDEEESDDPKAQGRKASTRSDSSSKA